jgi:AmmeMemoRadiSam system protein B
MKTVRHAAVAGHFYPDDPKELQRMIDALLSQAQGVKSPPKAIIAPHAGYVFSGPVAATAYARLASVRETAERVVLLGPSHRVALRGLALSSAGFFATPLGEIPVDHDATNLVHKLPQVTISDSAHAMEHSLEVHLPFLQSVLGDFSLIPIVVGDATPQEVGEVLDLLWDGEQTLVVISSDLSHYHDYATATRMDRETTRAIEGLRQDIQPEQACGCRPVNGLLHVAQRRDLRVTTLVVRNSGDTSGNKDRVVGYGAYALE